MSALNHLSWISGLSYLLVTKTATSADKFGSEVHPKGSRTSKMRLFEKY